MIKRRLGADVRAAGDRRNDAVAVAALVAALEDAADDALLPPRLRRGRACRRRRGRRAWRWCRCRRASGRRPCRGRARSCGCRRRRRRGGPNSSMWSISAPSAPRDALRVQRLADAPGEVGQRGRRWPASSRWPWSPTRKNQLPPQATSPVHACRGPARPRDLGAHAGSSARCAHVTAPSSCSVDGRRRRPAFRCGGRPAPMRPRWASVTTRPIVPWPHMPR